MIGSIVRSAASIVVSLMFAMAMIVTVEGIGAIVHPFPPEVDTNDIEAVKAHVARCPAWFLGVVVVLWGFTTFASAWIATRLGAGRHPAHGIVVGLMLLLAVVMNMLMLPYPVWFEVANLVTFSLAIYWGTKLGRGRSPNAEKT